MSSFPQTFISTVSHWQASNRGPTSLYNYGKGSSLSENAHVVIIGAGMTGERSDAKRKGASLAYQLINQGALPKGKKVAVLEAKDVASGATGRNGGHVRPASFHSYPGLIRPLKDGGAGHTPEEAVRILEDEEENMRLVAQIVEREKLNQGAFGADFQVFRNEAEKKAGKEALEAYTAAREKYGYPPAQGIKFVDDAEEAKKVSRTYFTRQDHAAGYAVTPAGMVHPHKLATALLRLALATGQCELYSWTPVSNFEKTGETWIVHTSEGDITAEQVVLVTGGG
ncbi:FAD dependent oxidoreductase [Dioszegia hungarica]|uniref:FAD dependent oxidoreductase n=1 Tax=Dioszegia hungarica TaxID=4972 RepID=A0AA38H7K5_9TREE|nr:FAD dependent oxidoreductase [Dioszegia hungarica]KAI9634339.1 FAD dependent oxidoreductase [Dioszegia hungarica]